MDFKGNLHCDSCDYVSEEQFAISRDLIGKPCPDCGASLLTEEDYRASLGVKAALEGLNALSEAIFGHRAFAAGDDPTAKGPLVGLRPHKGKLEISLPKKPGELT